jgi:hypothetical protein
MTTRNTEHLAATVAEHIEADAVVQGDYWSEDEQKGCFIGCLVHSNNPHLIEERYGVPVMITRIAEAIFERLPSAEATQFFADFPAAINNDGKDLSRVGWQFLAQTMRDLPVVAAEVQAVIDPVIAGLDRLAEGEEWSSAATKDADAAARACDAAARACDAVARAAARTGAAAARAAANAAAAARAAARDGAWADAAAAWSAASAAAWADTAAARAGANAADAARAAAVRQQRDLLLRLIREA